MSSNVSISDLTELPLLTIFDNLPLLDLLHIDEVCRAWQELKTTALRRRRHLILANEAKDLDELSKPDIGNDGILRLVVQEDGSPYMKFKVRLDRHVLFIGRNPMKTAVLDLLLELMPNLKVLRVVQKYGHFSELWKVKQLLAHYRHQLVDVTIWFYGALSFMHGEQSLEEVQRNFKEMFTSLMASLNQLTVLRSLEVNLQPAPNCVVDLDNVACLLNVVHRLKKLNFHTRLEYNNPNDTGNYAADSRLLKRVLFQMRDGSVKSTASGSKEKQEDLELYVAKTPLTLRTLISLGPGPVASGLRSVEIDGIFNLDAKAEYNALARFARQCPRLQKLTVGLKGLCIKKMAEALASADLKDLVHLSISCGAIRPPAEVAVKRLPVLPSVKSLKLTFPALSHRDYEQFYLETLFPNLQVVLWNHVGWSCPDCGYEIQDVVLVHGQNGFQADGIQFKADYGRQLQACLRQARLAGFSRLPRLTYLWLNVRPSNMQLPFKDQLFTSRVSLGRTTQFVDISREDSSQSSSVVVYND